MGMPETRYARSGDVMVAYQVVGQGPFDVVIAPPWVSHVELVWETAGWTTFLRGLAEHARVLLFDKRGTGLSDRVAGVPTLEERSDDIRAVMEAAGSERAAVFGVSESVPMSVVFTASHPESVSALALYGGFARALWAPDYRFGDTEREARKAIEEDFEAFMTPGGLEALVREALPSVDPSVDEKEVRAWARMFRYGTSPGSYEALDRMNMAIDVRDVLPLVSAPTLVLHQRADPTVRAEHGHYLAQHIPGATYVELDGDTHLFTAATVPQLLAQAVPFLQAAAAQEVPEPEKVLATVRFPTLSARPRGQPNLATRDGGSCWPPTTDGSAHNWPGSAGWNSTPLGTGFSPASTDPPGRSAAHRRSATRCARSTCRCAWACTPVSARFSMARSRVLRSRSARGCLRGRRQVRCWYPRQSKTWSPGPGSPSKTAAWQN